MIPISCYIVDYVQLSAVCKTSAYFILLAILVCIYFKFKKKAVFIMQATDLTHIFKAGVMSAKTQQKHDTSKKENQPQKAATKSKRNEFAKKAKEICSRITNLRNLLIDNRRAYLRVGYYLKNAARMTDEQRDLIDSESQKFVAYYTNYLSEMRNEYKKNKYKPQALQHMDSVIDLLMSYLRGVENLYLEQKKYRVQYEMDTFRMIKLVPDKSKIPMLEGDETSMLWTMRKNQYNDDDSLSNDSDEGIDNNDKCDDINDHQSGDSNASSEMDLSDGWQLNKTNTSTKSNSPRSPKTRRPKLLGANVKSPQSLKVALDEDIQKSQQETSELSPEDMQILEQENKHLYEQLQGVTHEVEAIEKNVVEISQLQDIFTEKVALQQHNIERIVNAVVGTTENVKDANEQIMQAIQRNAGLRVWSLFFLLVMSFALLFLDWYYD